MRYYVVICWDARFHKGIEIVEFFSRKLANSYIAQELGQGRQVMKRFGVLKGELLGEGGGVHRWIGMRLL